MACTGCAQRREMIRKALSNAAKRIAPRTAAPKPVSQRGRRDRTASRPFKFSKDR